VVPPLPPAADTQEGLRHVRLNYGQLEGLWIEGGGSRSTAPIAAAIAMAESSGNTNAESDNPDGGTNVGPWQLDTNGVGAGHSVSELKDPVTNAQLAVKGSGDGRNWSDWATFASGTYRKFLRNDVPPVTAARLDSATGLPNPIAAGLGEGLGLGSGIPGEGLGPDIADAGHILGDVASGAWWRRVGKGALAGVLILAGVWFVMEKEGVHPVKSATNLGTRAAKVAAK
jgi:hypothetical protein